jgi:hypothetical protein
MTTLFYKIPPNLPLTKGGIIPSLEKRGKGRFSDKCQFNYEIELIAKVSNGHPPQPLPSREGLIYQPSTLVGEGKSEGVMDFCKRLISYEN